MNMFTTILIFIIIRTSAQAFSTTEMYIPSGPVTNAYFQALNVSNIRYDMNSIQCKEIVSNKTNSNQPLIYYSVNITRDMKVPMTEVYTKTCCDERDITLQPVYCDQTSLDTVIYILRAENNQLQLLETSDDIHDTDICGDDSRKSFVNLTDYAEGAYIIAVGAYGRKLGAFMLTFACNWFFNDPYRGSVHEEWFQIDYEHGAFDEKHLFNLTCGDQYFRNINTSDEVHYYRVNITKEIIAKYTSEFVISTCCADKVCDSCTQKSAIFVPEFVCETLKYWFFNYYEFYYTDETIRQAMIDFGYDEYDDFEDFTPVMRYGCMNSTVADIAEYQSPLVRYDENCIGHERLESIIYVLKEENETVHLTQTIYDSALKQWNPRIQVQSMDNYANCQNYDYESMENYDHGGYIDLREYEEGEYIIGIGGYDLNTGPYAIQMTCEQYGYPMKATEFNPYYSDINPVPIKCNQQIYDQENTEDRFVSYFAFNISADTFGPIRITTCLNRPDTLVAVVYLFKLEGNEYTYIAHIDQAECNAATAVLSVFSKVKQEHYGQYFIGIQGWYNEPGTFSLSVRCVTPGPTYNPSVSPTDPTPSPTVDPTESPTFKYSLPITKQDIEMFLVSERITTINCETSFSNQSNTEELTGYQFNITDKTYPPIIISTCPKDHTIMYKNKQLYAIIYIIKEFDDTGDFIIVDRATTALCDGVSAQIDISYLPQGTYYAIIQGENHDIGDFSISMTCEEPPPKLSREIVMGLIFGTCGTVVLFFLIYYIYEWKRYCDRTKQCCYSQNSSKFFNSISVNFNSGHSTIGMTPLSTTSLNTTQQIQQSEDSSSANAGATNTINTINTTNTTNTPLQVQTQDDNTRMCCFCCKVDFDDENNENEDNESIKPGDARRIDGDQEFTQQLVKDGELYTEDVVQLVFAHGIQSFDDQEGLDIYQVLAMRYYDKESRDISVRKPLTRIGLNIDFISISPFAQAAFMACVVGLTQTVGTSIVIYKIFDDFFQDGITEDLCPLYAERWDEVYSLKILSFLLSIIVTFYISIIMHKLEHSGLYEMLDKLSSKDMERIDCIVIWILQIGQGINYYACLLAVAGSYFIIYEANQGESDPDNNAINYSHSGLDMILNAVALFFLLEVDDVIVCAQDYNDSKEHLERVLKSYTADVSINKDYEPEFGNDTVCLCGKTTRNVGTTADENVEIVTYDPTDDSEQKLDTNDYNNWNGDDVLNWIMCLDNSRYTKYKSSVQKFIKKQHINGKYIPYITGYDLGLCGIDNVMDRYQLLKQINSINNAQNVSYAMDEEENKEKLESSEDESDPVQPRILKLNEFMDWNGMDVIDWIVSLNEKYQQYRANLWRVKDVIEGPDLLSVERTDLKKWGISKIDARNAIYQEIRIRFKNKNSKCLKCMVPSLNVVVNGLSVFVKICCYGCGFFAPFFIFFCW